MYSIPTSISVGKQSYHIRNDGDFRMVLDCFAVLDDVELTKEQRILSCLLMFYDLGETDEECLYNLEQVEDIETLAKEMMWFFNGGSDNTTGAVSHHRLIDWEQDSQLVCSAINKVAGKEIRAEKFVHWWTFLAYYMAVGEGPLATVVSIRDKIVKGKKLEKYEQEFRRENPHYFMWDSQSIEEREENAYIMSLWNADKVE